MRRLGPPVASHAGPGALVCPDHARRGRDGQIQEVIVSNATLRASTIASLGVAGPVAAADPPPALFAALDDESGFNRAAAIRTLARFPDAVDRLIPTVRRILENEQFESPVREACAEVFANPHPTRELDP